jgi:hypothetical protein
MAESDSDVLEINVDPEDEKKNCEGMVFICISIQRDATVSWFLLKKLYMFRACERPKHVEFLE